MSEYVQSLLPYKTFQIGDVIANLLGSSLGLFVSYNLEKYYRRRREIARLYQPLDQLPEDLPSDEDEPMLPMYHAPQKQSKAAQPRQATATRLGNVWDSREEIFGIGEDEEEEEDDGGNDNVGGRKVAPAPANGAPKRSVRFS